MAYDEAGKLIQIDQADRRRSQARLEIFGELADCIARHPVDCRRPRGEQVARHQQVCSVAVGDFFGRLSVPRSIFVDATDQRPSTMAP
jgi:hypothetical protein